MHSSQSSKALTEASRARAHCLKTRFISQIVARKEGDSPGKRRLAQESRNHPALVGLFWLDLKHPFAALDCILIRRLRNQPLDGAQSRLLRFLGIALRGAEMQCQR